MSTSVTGAFGAAGSSPNGGGSRVGAAVAVGGHSGRGLFGLRLDGLTPTGLVFGHGNFRGENGNIRNGCGYFKSNESLSASDLFF